MRFELQTAAVAALLGAAGAQRSYPDPPAAGLPFPDSTYSDAYSPNAASANIGFNEQSPPKYPSPWMNPPKGDKWEAAYNKARDFVSKLTLLEKVNITTGTGWESNRCVGNTGSVPRLGFRGFCNQDSPLGVRDTDFNSAFPAGVNVAATWSRTLANQRGAAMGAEHRGKGVDIQLGPVSGPLGRAPEGGRNWEGFSIDPYLSGVMIAQSVQGIQSSGVIACSKHFIMNEQEHFRQAEQSGYGNEQAISTNVDDVTMHELYLWPFAEAVRAGTGSIMCSYNQINNSYACQNSYTLNYLLKNELDFQGFVMSDWSAQQSGVGSALAGLDMTMPGDIGFDTGTSYWGANLTIAVLNGTLPMWRLDDMVTRIMSAYYYVGRDTNTVPINFDSWTLDTYGNKQWYAGENYGVINEHVNVRGQHGGLIRAIGAQSTVLLKNTKGALPLTGNEKLTAIIGEDAGPNPEGPNGCSDRGCDNGTLAMGWGSGTANFPYLVTPLDAISAKLTQNYNDVQFVINNGAMDEIAALARQATVSLVFVNADSGEGYIGVGGNQGDRNNLTVWRNGDAVINQTAAYCNNTIVIVHSVGPVLLETYAQHPNVTGILWAGLPGEQSGNSIVDVLYGRQNPSAKLPFTIGKDRKSYGTDLLYEVNEQPAPQQPLKEGVFVDYRGFQQRKVEPTYEFGFGLSYTTFSYSGLKVITRDASRPYAGGSGYTNPAPTGSNSSSSNMTSSYLYPRGFHQVKAFIYPYLNSTNLRAASGDPAYGSGNGSIPAQATNGSAQPVLPAGGNPGGNFQLYDVLFTIQCTITNTGKVVGNEVPQLYVSLGGPNNPPKVLRGFDNVQMQPGGSTTVLFDLTRKDLSNWDAASQNWKVNSYPKSVYVGASSKNLPLSAQLPSFS